MSFQTITRFKGLNNVSDPLRLGLGWLSVADNIDVISATDPHSRDPENRVNKTMTSMLKSREGFTRRITAPMSGGYSTVNHTRAYVVSAGAINRVNQDMTLKPIYTLLGADRAHWAEANDSVYFSNGLDYVRIEKDDHVTQWAIGTPAMAALSAGSGSLVGGLYRVACTFVAQDGRESGAGVPSEIELADDSSLVIQVPQQPGCSTYVYIATPGSSVFSLATETFRTEVVWDSGPDVLGVDLSNGQLNDIPVGSTHIEHHKGRMYAALYLPDSDSSVIWVSKPLQYHLWDLDADFVMVPGAVRVLASAGDVLVIGTSLAIHAYNEESLTPLAPYGVVDGWAMAKDPDTGKVLLWTERGVCEALPFKNITQDTTSVPPGAQAGLAIVQRDGQKKLIATVVDGGAAFNQRL